MFFVGSEAPLNPHVDQILFRIGPIPVSMHTITLILVTVAFVLAMMWAAKAIATGPESTGNDRYITKGRFAQMVEAMVVYLRDEMLKPVLGAEATRKYLPFLMTVFFFVLFNNIFGMLPIAPLFELVSLKNPDVKQL